MVRILILNNTQALYTNPQQHFCIALVSIPHHGVNTPDEMLEDGDLHWMPYNLGPFLIPAESSVDVTALLYIPPARTRYVNIS